MTHRVYKLIGFRVQALSATDLTLTHLGSEGPDSQSWNIKLGSKQTTGPPRLVLAI